MKRYSKGFGLIEIMLSLTVGLVVIAGVTQIFSAAKNTYLTQNASAAMQEDARFVLSKMIQEIRMVGMFGCLASVTDASAAVDFASHFATPIHFTTTTSGGVTSNVLTLVAADVGTTGGKPDWTVVSDCLTTAIAYTGNHVAAPGQLAFAIRKVIYTFTNNQILISNGTSRAVLLSNVSAFSISFGVATSPTDTAVSRYTSTPTRPANIRSVRLSLTLTDPDRRVRDQTFNVVAALRNRLL